MQSITLLPAEVARALRGVCFDVDDTVTRHGVLEVSAYQALARLRAIGFRLIALTGRPLGFAEVIARMWPVDAAVGENGAGFCARLGASVCTTYWNDDATRAQHAAELARIRERVARELPEVRVASDHWARRCDLAFDIGEEQTLPAARIEQLTSIIGAEGATALVSSVHAHAQLGVHDKATGAAFVAERLWQLPSEHVRSEFLFVGDSGNDAAAFAWFHHTAGVANVRRHLARLPTLPRYVAEQECGAGFAEIVDVLLQKRAQS